MRIIKEADYRKEIKSNPANGYLFFGEEDYLKAFALKTARETVCGDPTFAIFNEMKIEALEFSPQKLLDALMPLPMMAEKKLVTVSGLNFNTMKQSELEELCEVLSELPHYDYNLLIITVASDCLEPGYLPKKPSSTLSKLGAHLTVVNFERSTPQKLAAWAQRHFLHNDVEVSAEFCTQLIDFCGRDMFILANEIDKLSFYVRSHGKTTATEEELHRVCISANEYDAFAFTNAIMDNRQSTALKILADYRFRRVDPLFVLGDVTKVICEMVNIRALSADGLPISEISSQMNLHEYKVGLYQKSLRNTSSERLARALDACIAADTSIKNSSNGYTALERLICTL